MGCSESVEITQGQRQEIVDLIQEPLVKASFSEAPSSMTKITSDKVDFSTEIREIKQLIMALPEQMTLVRNQVWERIFNKFEKLYLNANEKAQLIEFFIEFLNANFIDSKQYEQINFCGTMGQKFHHLENRIYFKHKYCLQNFFFAIKPENKQNLVADGHFGALKLDMSDEQVQKMTGKVRNLCQNDLNSFSFITLYLIHAMNKFLESNKSLSEVQNLLGQVLGKLQKLYPASSNKQNIEAAGVEFKNFKNVKFQKKFNVIKFQQGEKNKYDQLKDFVIEQANNARQDKDFFWDLVHKTCIKKGYGWKHGLKIKNANDHKALFRTIQKILDEEKYEQVFKKQKQKIMAQAQKIQKNQKNTIKSFVQMEKNEVKKLIMQILDKENEINFDAKDLLRAKCIYSQPEQLYETVEDLFEVFIENNISLIDFKNRLNNKTKDVTFIISLPHSIAQLQLALKFDTTSNQFNHKIYELLRSRIYTPLTNLYVQNQNWSSTFFTDQFEIFHQIVKQEGMQNFDENITFKEIENEVIQFKHTFLSNEYLSIAIQNSEDNAKTNSQILVKPLKELKELLQKQLNQDNGAKSRLQNQLMNEVSFYQKQNNYQEVEKLLSLIQSKPGYEQNNTTILNLQADAYFQQANYAQSLRFYKRLAQVNAAEEDGQVKTTAYAKKNAGLSCKFLGYFQEGLQSLLEALQIYKKECGTESQEYAEVLYCLGMLYDDMDDLQKSLESYQTCLSIQEKICGKQSIEVSKTIHNMGLLYDKKGQNDEALNSYEKCLKIQQNVKGKQSIECAITLGNMGVIYNNMQDFDKALQIYERSFEIKQKVSGRNSIDCSIVLNNIGMIYQQRQNYEKALNCYLESTTIKQNIKGKDDIDVAYSYLNLSILYCSMKRYTDAIKYGEMSYEIRTKVLGVDNSDTALSLQWVDYEKGLLEGGSEEQQGGQQEIQGGQADQVLA